MLIGAINASNDKANSVLNVLDGKYDAVPATARSYRAKGLRWIVIADENYGEGSSREHAALEVRFLGGAAVIGKSFARIHETNLKKQGILPLYFDNIADYDRIDGEKHRLSILNLEQQLKPGAKIQVEANNIETGKTLTFQVKHTMNYAQIGWFKSGSALNEIKKQQQEKQA